MSVWLESVVTYCGSATADLQQRMPQLGTFNLFAISLGAYNLRLGDSDLYSFDRHVSGWDAVVDLIVRTEILLHVV